MVPSAFLEWRFEKPGNVTQSDAAAFVFVAGLTFDITFHTAEQTPSGMVYVTAGDRPSGALIAGLDHLPPRRLRDFWIDKYEVTNREFKRFLDAGGYRDPKYWRTPIVDGGRILTFEQAVSRFTDSTRRPGPATWESGSFIEGQDDLPVTGVSWYEASAYAAFAGKSLPTIFHWSRVADQRLSGVVAPRSNFRGKGLMKVGASGGMNRYGAFDLAGNVKEWCWNRSDDSKRYIMGGAWDEPAYLYNDPDARAPLERAANFGFRGVKYSDDDPVARTGELVAFEERDFRKEKPVSDQVFATYRTLFEYDRGELAERIESADDSNPDWRVERVSFNAAYGHERVPALLYLPKKSKPPYQTVVYFPGSGVISQRSSAQINTRAFEWVIKSGRAFVHPIYKSTFERGDEVVDDYPNQTNIFREHVIEWAKDVRRTVDFLESRPDVDRSRVAYLGASWGSDMAPIYLAMEPRFKTAVLLVPGFYTQRALPEAEAINYAPRVTMPTLLLNGRFDFFSPEDTTQVPFFNLLGTQADQKRRVVYDTGHNIPRPDLIRESLDWLDRYLGPVR
jgi:formylglycine-generating enzyme required for sulfatase activity/dienelactone hydrolase